MFQEWSLRSSAIPPACHSTHCASTRSSLPPSHRRSERRALQGRADELAAQLEAAHQRRTAELAALQQEHMAERERQQRALVGDGVGGAGSWRGTLLLQAPGLAPVALNHV